MRLSLPLNSASTSSILPVRRLPCRKPATRRHHGPVLTATNPAALTFTLTFTTTLRSHSDNRQCHPDEAEVAPAAVRALHHETSMARARRPQSCNHRGGHQLPSGTAARTAHPSSWEICAMRPVEMPGALLALLWRTSRPPTRRTCGQVLRMGTILATAPASARMMLGPCHLPPFPPDVSLICLAVLLTFMPSPHPHCDLTLISHGHPTDTASQRATTAPEPVPSSLPTHLTLDGPNKDATAQSHSTQTPCRTGALSRRIRSTVVLMLQPPDSHAPTAPTAPMAPGVRSNPQRLEPQLALRPGTLCPETKASHLQMTRSTRTMRRTLFSIPLPAAMTIGKVPSAVTRPL